MVRGYESAEAMENTWNSRLVGALQKRGFGSARFEPIYSITVGGQKKVRKPDIDFKDGGTHIISGKYGEVNEIASYRSAAEYQADLGVSIDDLGEVFAVVYPATSKEKYRLHVLPMPGRPGEVPFAADSLEELADRIVAVVQGRIEELKREPLTEEAPRLILNGAMQLAHALKGISDEDLEKVFGGHDFFVSVLQHRLRDRKKRTEALRLGGAYLFANQLLFYVLLSRAAETHGKNAKYPPISEEHAGSPESIATLYFEKVRDINYEPIYGFNVAQFLTGKGANDACRNLLAALRGLAPNLDSSDLVGQVFQTLIPFDIRKPLGAHFTNPRAAKLLARLAIEDSSVTVMDPACGSGTLLVSSYQRKMELSPNKKSVKLHKRFLEKDITGMDAMTFSAHLAVVNLASQQPLVNTDHVRMATTDSTIRKPGETIRASAEALPHEFLQSRLTDDFDQVASRRKSGAVQASRKREAKLELRKVDLVIMNPPFTSWDNMGKTYRDNMKMRFSNENPDYKKVLFWKISQQAFFILLSDRFLSKNGTVASVVPFTTFTGRAFHKLVEWFVRNYSIRYVILGLGRCSYSEDTSLTECMIVADKKRPSSDHRFTVLGTIEAPADWDDDDIESIANAAIAKKSIPDLVAVAEVEQLELLQTGRTLTDVYLSMVPEYDIARKLVNRILRREQTLHTTMHRMYERQNLKASRWVLGSEHLPYYGAKGLLVSGSLNRALKEGDRLVVKSRSKGVVKLIDRNSPGYVFKVPEANVRPAIRRFSLLPSLDCTKTLDLCIAKSTNPLTEIMESIYGSKDSNTYLNRIRETSSKWKGGRWESRITKGSSKVCIARRLDFAGPGTTLTAVWTKEPAFLAGDGYYLIGPISDREGQFLVMWLNSSIALQRMVGSITITRGTWAKIEEFMIEKLPVPAYWRFTERQWDLIQKTWNGVSQVPLPSIKLQLEQDHVARRNIDNLMLQLLRVPAKDRKQIALKIRKGILSSLEMLLETMTPSSRPNVEDDEEDDS